MKCRTDLEEEIKGLNIYEAYSLMRDRGFNVIEHVSESADEVYYENADGTEYANWTR